MHERDFQARLVSKLKERFPGCLIFKLDTKQGAPDLMVLYKDKWAGLECKISATASHRPNQDYYVSLMDDMGYASFIFPENEEEVLDELTQVFGV